MSFRALVLIPSYNTGVLLAETVAVARLAWSPVWVVIDGSTDGSAAALQARAADDPGLEVLVLPRNRGKGEAIRQGLLRARAQGYTHALTLDADGQHDPAAIRPMMARAEADPGCVVLGRPVFDASAPAVRVAGRRLSNGLARICAGEPGIGDALFGLRVYPIEALLRAFAATGWMRRFDFDPEAVVRLCRAGIRPVNMDSRVRYLRAAEGGVSHFHYLRDNLLLAFMFGRLLGGRVVGRLR